MASWKYHITGGIYAEIEDGFNYLLNDLFSQFHPWLLKTLLVRDPGGLGFRAVVLYWGDEKSDVSFKPGILMPGDFTVKVDGKSVYAIPGFPTNQPIGWEPFGFEELDAKGDTDVELKKLLDAMTHRMNYEHDIRTTLLSVCGMAYPNVPFSRKKGLNLNGLLIIPNELPKRTTATQSGNAQYSWLIDVVTPQPDSNPGQNVVETLIDLKKHPCQIKMTEIGVDTPWQTLFFMKDEPQHLVDDAQQPYAPIEDYDLHNTNKWKWEVKGVDSKEEAQKLLNSLSPKESFFAKVATIYYPGDSRIQYHPYHVMYPTLTPS